MGYSSWPSWLLYAPPLMVSPRCKEVFNLTPSFTPQVTFHIQESCHFFDLDNLLRRLRDVDYRERAQAPDYTYHIKDHELLQWHDYDRLPTSCRLFDKFGTHGLQDEVATDSLLVSCYTCFLGDCGVPIIFRGLSLDIAELQGVFALDVIGNSAAYSLS